MGYEDQPTYTPTLTHTLTHTHTPTLTYTPSHTLTYIPSLTHTLTHPLSHSFTHTQDEEEHVKNVWRAFLNLRARTYGRDRYDRRYWCLRYAGGVYLQGDGSALEIPAAIAVDNDPVVVKNAAEGAEKEPHTGDGKTEEQEEDEEEEEEDVLRMGAVKTCDVAPVSTADAANYLTTALVKPTWLTSIRNDTEAGVTSSDEDDEDMESDGINGAGEEENNVDEAKLIEVIRGRVDVEINSKYTLKECAPIPEGWSRERERCRQTIVCEI